MIQGNATKFKIFDTSYEKPVAVAGNRSVYFQVN